MRERRTRLCAIGLSALMAVTSFDAGALVTRAESNAGLTKELAEGEEAGQAGETLQSTEASDSEELDAADLDGAVATYFITYELDGGVNSAENPSSYQEVSDTITLKSPTKKGHTFKGWYADTEFKVRVKEIPHGSKGSKTLYAKWQVNSYTIAFDGNGATAGGLADLPNRSYGVTYSLRTNNFTKDGYIFAGWNTKPDGTGTSYANKATVSNLATKNGAVVTMYAQWRLPAYTISFDGNGSTSGSTKVMAGCECGADYSLNANGFKKTGYTFTGWNTKADGSGKTYKNSAAVNNLATKDGATVKLYAQWKVNTYNVVFDGNGADSGVVNSLSGRVYDKEYTLPINAFKREGYKFGGWNTKASGSGSAYENKAVYSKLAASNGATVTLYAQWCPRSYSIVFNGNGSTGGSTAGISCVYDKSYYLTGNGFKRTGYEFTGWNTKADGTGVKYQDGVAIKNMASTEGKVINLYAQWKIIDYKLTYELNGGTNAKTNPATYRVTSDTILLASPTRTGYTFKGWYKDSSFTTKMTQITAGSTKDRTLYAKWAANTYSIAFNGNGATSGSMTSVSDRTYDKAYTLKTNAFKRTGYEFIGWNTKADGSGVSYKNNESVKGLTSKNGATVTLYAQWRPIQYTLTYVLNGGTKQSNPASYTIESDTITLRPATRPGYIFKGWYKESTFNTKVTKINAGSTGGRIFYAKWEKDPNAPGDKYEILTDENGNVYDLGGMEIIVRDWWSGWDDMEPSNEYEEATQEYREWIQDTYNFTIKQVAVSDWGSTPADFVDYVTTGGDDNNYIFTLREDPVIASAMHEGLMYDLSTLSCLDFSADKFQANLVHKQYSRGKKIYAMAGDISEPRTGVFFNKRLLREAGINPEDLYDMQAMGTWTWDALINLCEKVQRDTNRDGVIDVYACNCNNSVLTNAAVASNGGEYVGMDASGKYTYRLEDSDTLDGLEFANFLFNNYWQEEPEGAYWDYYKEAFLNGEYAFMFEDAYVADSYGFLGNMKDDFGFVMFPKGPAMNDYTNVWYNNPVAIPACYDADKAWKIAFAWNLYTNETPGYENSDVWKGGYYNGFRDTRAVDETLAMMRKKGTVMYHRMVPGLQEGPELTWYIGPGAVISEVVGNISDTWKKYVEYANE